MSVTTITVQAADGAEHIVDVRYRLRTPGGRADGWYVVRADNGRTLGWVTQDDAPRLLRAERWGGRISDEAFRGAGVEDTGHVLDRVPGELTLRVVGNRHDTVTRKETRDEAALDIVAWLVDHRAPAVGFPAHPAVITW